MKRNTAVLVRLLSLAAALLLTTATLVGSAGSASALPTADFTFSPTQPAIRQPVTFTFTGTCDIKPCSVVDWTWFQPGGSSRGTHMGDGDVLTYAFPAAGAYTVVASITGAGSTHGFASATHVVVVRDTFEDFDRQVGYNSWRGVSDLQASAGGFRTSAGAHSAATFPFSGTDVTYVARTGPNLGIATVSVDGVSQDVDLYEATPGTKQVLVDGLTDAAHRIRVQPSGTKNPASSGTGVTLDEFLVGAVHTDDRSLSIAYDRWGGVLNADASGGSVRSNARAGARTTFGFVGTSVTWLTSRGPRQGLAAVFIDGTRVATVDGYAPDVTWQVPETFGGLTAAHHTIRVVVLGRHNAASTGNRVTSDAFRLG